MANSINDSLKKMADRAIATADGGTSEGLLTRTTGEQNQFNTVHNYNIATAPAANAAIASIAAGSLPAGYYLVETQVSIDAGAPAAAERDNMEIRAGAAVLKRIVMNPTASPSVGEAKVYVTLNGATALTVNANGAATAAVVYRASLQATRIS